MKFFLPFAIVLLMVAGVGELSAQQLRQDEVVVMNGQKFILHQVRTGETVFRIAKNFGIEQSELEALNPGISAGLKVGQILKIPYKSEQQLKQGSSWRGEPSGFRTHKIKRKETAYFIAKKYGISVEELLAYNKGVSIKRGKKLQVPYWNEKAKTEQPGSKEQPAEASELGHREMIAHKVKKGETLYSISKKYGISETEIVRINPQAAELKAGSILYFPAPNEEVKDNIALEAGGKYFEHIIESGETLWSTARKYGVSEKQLVAMNPILQSGFPAGAVIKIPLNEASTVSVKPENPDAFQKHEVKKGETLYGLSRRYEVSIPELKKYNPVLDVRNLVEGEIILIPKVNEDLQAVWAGPVKSSDENEEQPQIAEEYYRVDYEMEIPESCRVPKEVLTQQDVYDVALFLPLFLTANDTLNREEPLLDSLALGASEETENFLAELGLDSIKVERKEKFKRFYGSTENFVQFYEGVLLGIERLREEGIEVNLHVYDTQRQADSIRSVIATPEFLSTDLIIGPIYSRVQQDIAQVAAKNRIPMVSPLASYSPFITANQYFFQVNPSREYLAQQTAEMVIEDYYNCNLVVMKVGGKESGNDWELVDLLREKIVNAGLMSRPDGINFTIYDFQQGGIPGLQRVLSKQKENVVYIPASDEGSLSVAVSNLNALSDDYSITLIGSSRYPNYQSILLDYYFNLKLKFVSPYWVDYEAPNTVDLIKRFRDNFATEPNNFGMQGYDVTTYFLRALKSYGKDFGDCLPYFHCEQVQGGYHFEKVSQYGGYMNRGVSVIQYTRDYDVKRLRVKGRPRLYVAESADN